MIEASKRIIAMNSQGEEKQEVEGIILLLRDTY
jgi:hypothetical protein